MENFKFIFLPETNSTNKFAQNFIITNKQKENTIVLTDFQTDGVGQGNKKWHSEKGVNLLFSIVIYPHYLEARSNFLLSMITSISIAEVLKSYDVGEVNIKWPNDILLNNKKICGILIANQLCGRQIENSIIGVGLNVNQTDFPSELKLATSLHKESGKTFHLRSVLNDILILFDYYIELLKNFKLEIINHKYINLMFGLEGTLNFSTQTGELLEGRLIGIKQNGKIIVKIEDQVKSFDNSEIKIIL